MTTTTSIDIHALIVTIIFIDIRTHDLYKYTYS
jgi:hypothetical protein